MSYLIPFSHGNLDLLSRDMVEEVGIICRIFELVWM